MGRTSPSHLNNIEYIYWHIININNIVLCIALLNIKYIYTNQVEQKDTVAKQK